MVALHIKESALSQNILHIFSIDEALYVGRGETYTHAVGNIKILRHVFFEFSRGGLQKMREKKLRRKKNIYSPKKICVKCL